MRITILIAALACFVGYPSGSTAFAQAEFAQQLDTWLSPQATPQSRFDASKALWTRQEGLQEIAKRYERDSKAVSDALAFMYDRGDTDSQIISFYWTTALMDRAGYHHMVERALRSPNKDLRGNAFGAAAVFQDRSELMVSALLTEIRNTNAPDNLSFACRVSAKLQLQEAIEPMADLVANSSLARARGVAESLAQYPRLPAEVLTRLEAARTRFEREQEEANKRPKTPTQEWLEKQRKANGTPSEFELLFKALDKAKEKAQLPLPPGMEPTKVPEETKKRRKSAEGGKAASAESPAIHKESASSATHSAGNGRSSLLTFIGLVSLSVVAWVLLKSRLR